MKILKRKLEEFLEPSASFLDQEVEENELLKLLTRRKKISPRIMNIKSKPKKQILQ